MGFETVFFIIFGIVAASMGYKAIKNGGLKGAMFGAPVGRQIAELELGSPGMVKTKLKVHLLDSTDAGGPHVGIEVVQSTVGSWEMQPVSLTRTEARRLAQELLRAADASKSQA